MSRNQSISLVLLFSIDFCLTFCCSNVMTSFFYPFFVWGPNNTLGLPETSWLLGNFPLVVSSVLLISSEFAKWDSSILVLAGWDAAISTGWEGLATIPSEAESIWDVKSCWPVVTLWTLFKIQDYKSLLFFFGADTSAAAAAERFSYFLQIGVY